MNLAPNPGLVAWGQRSGTIARGGGRALVVECGPGDDAEELARWGMKVVAFDASAAAIDSARRRFPRSGVHYEVASLLGAPSAWARAFDFVFEARALQWTPRAVRPSAVDRLAGFVAPGGTLLVIARGRDEHEEFEGPSWPLAASDLERLERVGLEVVRFEDYMDEETPPQRRLRVQYERPRSGAS
jgi:ubiquinone/menaquinone biosynthesis C-methylase UbiE